MALRLLLTEAKVCLETFDLLDDGVEQALDSFADLVYEDMDHEWLYDDANDGIEDSPVSEALDIAPMGLADWFKPFNDGRYVHPYAMDALAGERDSEAGRTAQRGPGTAGSGVRHVVGPRLTDRWRERHQRGGPAVGGNEWLAEYRWQRRPLRQAAPAFNSRVRHPNGKGAFTISGQGSWSSYGHPPMGCLTDRHTGRTWLRQIEHNGGWTWECGVRAEAAFVAASGPNDLRHAWSHPLEPDGAPFRTVPVTLALAESGGVDEAFATLTRYRRAARRPHPDHTGLPVIFNDYMNCLMGGPTTHRLLPHIDAAAEAGAESFVIDAGWYDDEGGGWWDSVGAWEPAASRFPGERGIHEVLDHIRERGMVPGLWLEPEVVGVRSPLATTLPDEAFFRRRGVRVLETGRYHLDLRHPAVRAHLDRVVDRLVDDLGVGYLKLDYNVDAGPGTSAHPNETPANGLLGHNRAQLDWLEGILDRHPHLVLENCASGGMRADHALLSRLPVHSASDQQNLDLHAPIAAAAPTAVTPEQCAVWAYPQPDDYPDEVAFTMANALLGRIHLSSNLPELADAARDLVREAVSAYKAIRTDPTDAIPAWPLGLPTWDDPWIALALRTPDGTRYVTVWRRPGTDESAVLPLPGPQAAPVRVTCCIRRPPGRGRHGAPRPPR
ncbi:glycoside hydrolase family 36 protein [Streptomyces sp. NPDC050564]|uniref:glycoside hydrolase family 36 protein n=1 Tax=Streptomyces sp. NPDC050564 TaxID=3365631 RepID=UPI0037A2738C